MALLVFGIKGIPASRRERIAADVKAVETHLSESLEAWISWDSFGETARVLITGRLGLSGRFKMARRPERDTMPKAAPSDLRQYIVESPNCCAVYLN
jgi:hypothetical protein